MARRWGQRGRGRGLAGAALSLVIACSDDDGERRQGTTTDPAGVTDGGIDASLDAGNGQPVDAAVSDAAVRPDAGAALDDAAILALGAQLLEACPLAATNDPAARERCADALIEVPVLRSNVAEPLLWGGQPAGLPLERVPEQANLTSFSSFVWRRIYLSTLMFEGAGVLEQAGRYRALRVPVRFRNALDAGDYPYPFWHAEKKWASYEQATHLVFLFDDSKLVACVRSVETDASRPHTARTWDGVWTWDEGREPESALYRALFSDDNPFVASLDQSYRTLSDGLRVHTCFGCHSPDNPSMIRHLDILNYPNQSLSGRHRIVSMIEQNQMPPGGGIRDDAARAALLDKARAFATLGDRALAFEGEPITTVPSANAKRRR